jgi:hypothetical protein
VSKSKIKKDYAGCKFGKLTVVKFEKYASKNGNQRVWLCECECGRKISSTISNLKKRSKKDCGQCFGVKLKKDYSGQKFGKIRIIKFERYPNPKKTKDSMWLCECECGEKFVRRIRLVKNNKIQCCTKCAKKIGNKHPCWRGCGEISKDLFNSYVNGARDRNLEFSVTIDYMWDLFLKQNRKCALTGWDIYFPLTYRTKTQKTASPDRIDNNKGYIEGNIQWIHQDVNYLKSNLDLVYFVDICTAVAKQARKKSKPKT